MRKINHVNVLCILLIPLEDHWLGLEMVYTLTDTRLKKWTLRVDLWDFENGTAYAEYQNFKLENEKSAFKLQYMLGNTVEMQVR